ncbi:RNA polymerase sigma factor RpoH [Bradyrhizobium sp. ARR65]|uniref:RNA polymerase sigma factor RpoH n=1 Tax=Bradyrhizobium sp. ARR65 TaxID=1040989 RepID=UPI00068678B4|nr:RNA polymerase sigma factor RpoH [Bradyrhizobium sp. ARR65]
MQAATLISGSTARYLREVGRFPMLRPDEEYRLVKRWREQGDANAAHSLVTSHLRLAAKVAIGYRGYGLPVSDLISEGNVGLMNAVKRFDPERGVRFATYAIWWIKAAIHEYILRSWSLVKIGTTANQKKLFFNLRKAKGRISAIEEGDLHPDHIQLIARDLGVPKQEVVEMNRRLGGDFSLNVQVQSDGGPGEWQDHLVDEDSDQESRLADADELAIRGKALNEALTVLGQRERRIIEARWLADEPMTLDRLGAEFGISPERIRQIEFRAFQKLQSKVKRAIARKQLSVDPPGRIQNCASQMR